MGGDTVNLPQGSVWNFSAEKLWEAAVLDPEFRADSESGLRSAQSPAGKDEKFSQSPAAEMRRVLAGWLLAGRRLAAACCWLLGLLSGLKSQSVTGLRSALCELFLWKFSVDCLRTDF